MESSKALTNALNQAISEYLSNSGFSKALDAFNSDLKKTYRRKKDETMGLKSIMSAFQNGQRDNFFKLWRRVLPVNVREDDLNCIKIEFYIHIYFTIFPLHPTTGRSNQKKEFTRTRAEFKHFLDNRGAELSKTNEFLAYYALPYVEAPKGHPSFK